MSLAEIDEASNIINSAADEDANIIFGTVIDDSMDDQLRVTVIATGFKMQDTQTSMNVNTNRNAARPAANAAPAPVASAAAPIAPSTTSSYSSNPTGDSSFDSLFDDDIPDFLKRNRY